GEAVAAMLPQADDAGRPVRVTMLTRAGCHLCATAQAAIEQVLRYVQPPAGYARLDIDQVADPIRGDLLVRYGEWLPVTFVDGRQHDYWVIDPDRLRQALEQV
ncbi:MAG: glutaredoxin family protein, partial [Ornithinimicrobium sp.]